MILTSMAPKISRMAVIVAFIGVPTTGTASAMVATVFKPTLATPVAIWRFESSESRWLAVGVDGEMVTSEEEGLETT
jgi:hypothetical protein